MRIVTIHLTPEAAEAELGPCAGLERIGVCVQVTEPLRTRKCPARVELSAERTAWIDVAEQEMKLRRYSPRTRRAYLRLLRRFLADVDAGPITVAAMRAYVLAFVERASAVPLWRITDSCARHCGLVDGIVAAHAERLRARAIATFDVRHFGVLEIEGTPVIYPRDHQMS